MVTKKSIVKRVATGAFYQMNDSDDRIKTNDYQVVDKICSSVKVVSEFNGRKASAIITAKNLRFEAFSDWSVRQL